MTQKRLLSPLTYFYDRRIALSVWFLLCFFGLFKVFTEYGINNYLIFKGVYFHTLHEQNLYLEYPSEYGDVNLYGPLFSVIIAPFASLPDKAGIILWMIFNASFLAFAITKLPLPFKWQALLLLLCGHELMISTTALQINPFICSCIILGFAYTHRGKEFLALLFIMIATFIKIYGITGLAFFFFSKRKHWFIGWAFIWSVVLFFAPLLITSFSFLLHSYRDWLAAIKAKSGINILMGKRAIYQNVSVPGMIRRIFYLPYLNDMLVLVPAALLFLSQYLKYNYFGDIRYRLYLLSSVLIATVIFSTGAESNTYIIAMPGICIWYLLQTKTKGVTVFFILVFILTTLAYTDILTPWTRHHLYRPYSVKALPAFVVWLVIAVQIHKKQFLKAIIPSPENRLFNRAVNPIGKYATE